MKGDVKIDEETCLVGCFDDSVWGYFLARDSVSCLCGINRFSPGFLASACVRVCVCVCDVATPSDQVAQTHRQPWRSGYLFGERV